MKTCLIICGGRSHEHEISLISAKCVLDALDRSLWTPLVVGISKKGIWYLEEEQTFTLGECRADKIQLNEKAPTVSLSPFLQNGRGELFSGGKTYGFDVAFPILHGPFGEDGTIQGLFDIVGVPYVGSGCESSALCMDKALTKALCEREGIRVAPSVTVHSLNDVDSKWSAIETLGPLWFTKPARLGSSVGISKVTDPQKLRAAVTVALSFDFKCLIEKGIEGREFECALLGNRHSALASIPGEVIPNKEIGWYNYEAKYLLKDGAKTEVPAKLEANTTLAIQAFCKKIFQILECNGMARVDLFMENKTGHLYLNEVNTVPGFTPISMYPQMWAATGLPYPKLINRLFELAACQTTERAKK